MKKIYRSGNYVIAENGNGGVLEFAVDTSYYVLLENVYTIIDRVGGNYVINTNEITDYYNEDGNTAYDTKAFEKFLRENTAVFGGSSDGTNSNGGGTTNFDELFYVERDTNGQIVKVVSIYDLQVPAQSIEVGEAIRVSDLTQELGYTTKYDGRQYILMNYEITDDGNLNPTIKEFSSPSSFELQGLSDVQQSFSNVASFPLVAVQNVIGKIYNLKVATTSDLRIKLYRTGVTNYSGGTSGDIIPLSQSDMITYDVQGEDTLIVDETIPASQTDINGFDFELKPLTDFVSGASYRLDLSVPNGLMEIKGTLISPSFFFPYIKRSYGWEYEKKEIALKDDVPSVNNGNADAEFYHYSFSTGQDNNNMFNDGLVKIGWDYPGDVELTMLTEPSGTGDMVSLATKGNSSVVTKYITEPNTKYDVYPAGVGALEGLIVWISAEQDPLFPTYKVFVHNAGSSYNSVVEIKKIIPKNP